MSIADLFFESIEKSGDYTVKKERTGVYLIPAPERVVK